MNLQDLANTTLENFDAAKDSVNTFEGLKTGEYTVTLNTVDHYVSQGGWDGLRIILEVVEGDSAGRKDYNMFNFDQKTTSGKDVPANVLQGHIRLIAKLASLVGLELKDEDWESIDTITSAFFDKIGSTLTLKLNVRDNPKNPQYPYKNYDFTTAEQPEEIKVKDDDMPF